MFRPSGIACAEEGWWSAEMAGLQRANAATKKVEYPLPRTDDLLESLPGGSLDLQPGYQQFMIDPTDVAKMAF